jgi:hypothetical protein
VKRNQYFVLSAVYRAGAGHDTEGCRGGGSGRTGGTLRAGYAALAGRTGGALRARCTALTGRTDWSLRSRLALRALGADLSLGAGRAGLAPVSSSALRPHGSLGALRPLWSGRTDRSGRAGGARRPLRAGRPLRAWSGLASGNGKCR